MLIATLILHPVFKNAAASERRPEAKLEEAVGLAGAINIVVAEAAVVPISRPRPATLFGSGQIDRFKAVIEAKEITIVIVDTALSPVQQRNLEKKWAVKVIDRTALILEIFGARARTHEGKLQVELAALEYQKSRLVRSWTHLERQRGGFGFLGGPGESQIELDRRLIRERIDVIKRKLETVVRTRHLHRKLRQDTPFPMVAMVGYTNAGKSTLFNAMTKAGVLAENALFATLDPTIRQTRLDSGLMVMLSDTVGFISSLPTELVAAFRATLEEVLEADLLLHVRDMAHPDSEAQKADVETVLRQLFGKSEWRIIEVRNKVDLLGEEERRLPSERQVETVEISAITGEGLHELSQKIDELLAEEMLETRRYVVPASDGKAMAWLYAHSQVRGRSDEAEQCLFDVRISPINQARFGQLYPFGIV